MVDTEVLVVGAGPSGLVMAAELARFGVRVRVVDKAADRVHESRAMAIQPRTLEVLSPSGVADRLVALGDRAVRMHLHAGRRVRQVPLFDLGLADTAYPYLLFLSQAATERVLDEHLTGLGVPVERGVELVGLEHDGQQATAWCAHPDGRREGITARYVVGCDGAHSTVRRLAGIGFAGSAYPQTFVLADLEADGLAPDAVHAFFTAPGPLLFFPLGSPATWRLVAMRPPGDPAPPDAAITLAQVRDLVDAAGDGAVEVRDPAWMSTFRLHHRAAERYRAGPVFLAGDAAHIHSPAGAQGMNTGIQDAVNLGWKIAAVLRGGAGTELLDTYHDERAPIGRTVLRFTDRAFTAATATNPLARLFRARVAPLLLPTVLRFRPLRGYAFRTVSQLGIRYRRSPLSVEGPRRPAEGPRRPVEGPRRSRTGPRAGDRLPDAAIGGPAGTLHRLVGPPGWHLLLCGPAEASHTAGPDARLTGRLSTHQLSVHRLPADGPHAEALHRLGLGHGGSGRYLVRPDGHIGYRDSGQDHAALLRYLDRWLPADPPHSRSAP